MKFTKNLEDSQEKLSISKESSLPFLCEALHKKGICHRDIKIENILLIEKNNINNIILSDLGLSTL